MSENKLCSWRAEFNEKHCDRFNKHCSDALESSRICNDHGVIGKRVPP